MNADELFAMSCNGQLNQKRKPNGMSTRTFNVACRRGLANADGLDLEKVRAVIETGEIWWLRGVGAKTVRELCEWAAQQMTQGMPPG